jgi:GntR family transcriptional regulator, transcriptional repressor for pyruvate dehydrogenase complex
MDDRGRPIFTSKAQQVAHLLLNRIIEGNLRPGSSLGTEAQLLETYQVSRPTLRECLRVLEAQKVLSMRPGPGGGIILNQPGIDNLVDTLSVYLRLNNVPLIEILRARMAIEPVLVRDAAIHGTAQQYNEMEETIRRLDAAQSSAVLYEENRAFHGIIATASHNPVLEIFWLMIHTLASGEGENLAFSKGNISHIVKSHREILAACRARDSQKAEQLMKEHLVELDELLRRRARKQESAPNSSKKGRKRVAT